MLPSTMNNLFGFIFLALFSCSAFADQCSVLPISSAIKAKEILNKHLNSNSIAVIDRYCESCRDEMATPIVIDTIELKSFQVHGYNEIYVNDKKIDLAYIYLDGNNIASQVGCNTIGVSKYL